MQKEEFFEEYLNAITHYIGAGIAFLELIILIIHSIKIGEKNYIIGCIIFSIGLIFMYLMSGTYHMLKTRKLKKTFRILDHISIYVSISSAYTPYIFTVLSGKIKWIIFFAQWGLTSLGVIFKLFFTGQFKLVSTLIYLFMGWMIVFIFKDIKVALNPLSLKYLIISGITYSVGAIIYMIKNMRYSHTIWHIFVIGGSFFNFLSIYYIPT